MVRPALITATAVLAPTLAAMLLLASGCGPRTAEGTARAVRDESRAGIVVLEGMETFTDGEWRKQGPFIFRDDRGDVIAQGSYVDGKEHGPWSQTIERVRGEGRFEDGSRTGEWMWYHPNGGLQDTGSYDRGLRTGLWRSYRDDGSRLREAEYKSGELDGKVTYYGPDGSTVDRERSGTYSGGQLR